VSVEDDVESRTKPFGQQFLRHCKALQDQSCVSDYMTARCTYRNAGRISRPRRRYEDPDRLVSTNAGRSPRLESRSDKVASILLGNGLPASNSSISRLMCSCRPPILMFNRHGSTSHREVYEPLCWPPFLRDTHRNNPSSCTPHSSKCCTHRTTIAGHNSPLLAPLSSTQLSLSATAGPTTTLGSLTTSFNERPMSRPPARGTPGPARRGGRRQPGSHASLEIPPVLGPALPVPGE
jgi:hypothetical protein